VNAWEKNSPAGEFINGEVYISDRRFAIKQGEPGMRNFAMSEHHDAPKSHEPHAQHEEHASKGPNNPKEINPKMASDIAYWSKEFGVTGDQLHESIRSHGTHVDKIRAALRSH
jgi:hypothetical protein